MGATTTTETGESPMLREALTYTASGLSIIPLHHPVDGVCSCRNPECSSPAKHPITKNGLKDASIDDAKIYPWWTRRPFANIGLLTGSINGIVVLDVDGPEGERVLATLIERHGDLPITAQVLTGRGRQFYFAAPADRPLPNSAGKIGRGLDFRAENGYVVAPPSEHITGRKYRWAEGRSLAEVWVEELPAWLLTLAEKPSAAVTTQGTNGAALVPNQIERGSRNDTFFRMARAMRARGLTEEATLAALRVENEQRCNPPLPDSELSAIIKNAFHQPDRADFAANGAEVAGAAGCYRETPHGLVRIEMKGPPDKQIEIPHPLTNFRARIVADISRDDGAETTRVFEIEAHHAGRSKAFAVPAAQFPGMRWTTEHLGAQAVVYAGQGTVDHARVAIQLLSNPASRVAYAHSGWRLIDGASVYLHSGGGIGANGAVAGVEVELPPELAPFRLELPTDAILAIRASLGILDLGPDRITVPILGTVYRAVLGSADFSLYLFGPTGIFKTEMAALVQQHFGAGFDARHLPTSFTSTANTNEALAFTAKDGVLVVDEFRPPASGSERELMHRDANRLMRAQGNAAGRGRMRADGTLRPAKPPRGLLLVTGEEAMRGQSASARMLVVEARPGDISALGLSACQADAAAGLYAQSLACFVRWLAGQLPAVRAEFEAMRAAVRAEVRHEHARTGDIHAQLIATYSIFGAFLIDSGVIDEAGLARFQSRIGTALQEVASAQAQFTSGLEPTAAFFRLLSSAIGAGRAHLADRDGNAPAGAEKSCGWRDETIGQGDSARLVWRPQGDRVGWLDGVELYLDRDASYRAGQAMDATGAGIEVSATTLARRLRDRHLLVSTDPARETLTVRRTLGGAQRDVLHLSGRLLGIEEAEQGGAVVLKCRAQCRVFEDLSGGLSGKKGQPDIG